MPNLAVRIRRTLIAGLLLLPACARLRGPARPPDDSDLVIFHVVNHNLLNMDIYNVVHGSRDRLGEVTAVSSATFHLHLKRLVGGDARFYADPVGSSHGTTSEMLHLSPGDSVTWTLEIDLGRSHIEIH
jgi:hypothetical protein